MVVGTGGGTQRKLASVSKLDAETSLSPVYSANFSMSSGWFEIAGLWTSTGSNAFDFTGELFSRGQDGTAGAILVSSLTSSFLNPDLASATQLFAGISLQGSEASYFDDFVVPEPPPTLLLLFGVFIMGVVLRSSLKASRLR